jgi:hypothetical protein
MAPSSGQGTPVLEPELDPAPEEFVAGGEEGATSTKAELVTKAVGAAGIGAILVSEASEEPTPVMEVVTGVEKNLEGAAPVAEVVRKVMRPGTVTEGVASCVSAGRGRSMMVDATRSVVEEANTVEKTVAQGVDMYKAEWPPATDEAETGRFELVLLAAPDDPRFVPLLEASALFDGGAPASTSVPL